MPGGKTAAWVAAAFAVTGVALTSTTPAGPTSAPSGVVAEITEAAARRAGPEAAGDVTVVGAYGDLCARIVLDPEQTGKAFSDSPGAALEQAVSFAEAQRAIGILTDGLLRSQSMDTRFVSAEALSRLAPQLPAVDQARVRVALKAYLAAGPCGPWNRPPSIIVVFSGEDNLIGERTTKVLRATLDRIDPRP